jgi:type I restriction enzyme S subunit
MSVQLHPVFGTEIPDGWSIESVDSVRSPEKSSCVAGPFGSDIASKYFVESGVPVIRGSNLTANLIPFVGDRFVFVSHEREKYAAQHVRAGDLVFTCWGTIGQVGLIPECGPFDQYVISNKQLKLRPDPARVNSRFLYYYFACPDMVEYIRNRAIGSAVPGINLGILKALPVVLPNLDTQIRISEALGLYDELIENNTRRIKILEEMAQSIYKEWFVNFRYPGHENVPLVDSERGPIPEGWDTIPLSEVSELVSRGVSPKYDEDSDALVVNQKCVRDGRLSMALSRRHSSRVPEAKMLRFGDVLINSTGVGTLGRVAQVYEDLADVTADSHVTIVRPNQLLAHTDFLGLALLGLADEFASMGAGSTGQTELSRARIGAVVLAVPPRPLQGKFSEMAEPLRRLSVALAAANRNLRATRDLLLPRLVSGEIDVSDLDLSCE